MTGDGRTGFRRGFRFLRWAGLRAGRMGVGPMILRALIIWASAASLMAVLSYWQWGVASERADKADAALAACKERTAAMLRDMERDNEIDNLGDDGLRNVPPEWLLDF